MYGIYYIQGWPEPHIYGVHTVFLAGESPNIRSHTVYICGSGQPYTQRIRTKESKRVGNFYLAVKSISIDKRAGLPEHSRHAAS